MGGESKPEESERDMLVVFPERAEASLARVTSAPKPAVLLIPRKAGYFYCISLSNGV